MERESEKERDRQRKTEKDIEGQRKTEKYRERQRKTEKDKERQRKTEKDRERQREHLICGNYDILLGILPLKKCCGNYGILLEIRHSGYQKISQKGYLVYDRLKYHHAKVSALEICCANLKMSML